MIACLIVALSVASALSGNAIAASWECVSRLMMSCHTWRMATPDGWLVSGDNSEGRYAMTYVPDQEHKWRT